jgi:drug/metabolite transporter (DMT)-like permease
MPRDLRTWGHAAAVAALLNAAPFALFAIGEQHVSSVLAGVINATTPAR